MVETKMKPKPLTEPMTRLLRKMKEHGEVMIHRSWGGARSASFFKSGIPSSSVNMGALDGLVDRGFAEAVVRRNFGSATCRLTVDGLEMAEKLGPEPKQDLGKVYWVDYSGAVHSAEIESETEKTIKVKGWARVGDETFSQIPKERTRTKICRTAREAVEEYRKIKSRKAKDLIAESVRTQEAADAAADLLGPFKCVDCGETFDVAEDDVYLVRHLPQLAKAECPQDWVAIHKHKDDKSFHQVVRVEVKS